MAIVTWYVGLDYHQAKLQVCVMDAKGKVRVNRYCANNWQAVAHVVAAKEGEQVVVAIEACCGAANLADELITHLGWEVQQAHAGYVSRIKQNPDKSDYTDARLLADLVRVGYLPKVWLAPEQIRDLRKLVRFRADVIKKFTASKLRIRALLRESRQYPPLGTRAWTRRWLMWLREVAQVAEHTRWVIEQELAMLEIYKRQKLEVEARMEALAGEDAIVQQLRAQKGIGLVTAVTLRAEIGRFDRFASGKQLSRFCGLTPRNASSGERESTGGIIKAGNTQLRMMIIQAGHRLMNYDARWQALGARLMQQGKPRSVAVVAVANRWMRWLYHQMQPAQLAA